MENKYYVYMMTNKNNNVLYIGVTDNLCRRVNEHKTGAVEGFTKKYNVKKLVYAEQFNEVKCAIAREKQLKGWVRVKKNNLIASVNPNWEEIAPF